MWFGFDPDLWVKCLPSGRKVYLSRFLNFNFWCKPDASMLDKDYLLLCMCKCGCIFLFAWREIEKRHVILNRPCCGVNKKHITLDYKIWCLPLWAPLIYCVPLLLQCILSAGEQQTHTLWASNAGLSWTVRQL